jgi:hypothetical protein
LAVTGAAQTAKRATAARRTAIDFMKVNAGVAKTKVRGAPEHKILEKEMTQPDLGGSATPVACSYLPSLISPLIGFTLA